MCLRWWAGLVESVVKLIMLEAKVKLHTEHRTPRPLIVDLATALGSADCQIAYLRDSPLTVPPLLEAFDVFALPSVTEGIPIALLEAGTCARPIVTSRVGGVPEVICHGKSGLFVEAGDVMGLAVAIDTLLRQEPLAQQWGRQAAETVANRYGMPAMINSTQQAYEAALAHREANRL